MPAIANGPASPFGCGAGVRPTVTVRSAGTFAAVNT